MCVLASTLCLLRGKFGWGLGKSRYELVLESQEYTQKGIRWGDNSQVDGSEAAMRDSFLTVSCHPLTMFALSINKYRRGGLKSFSRSNSTAKDYA
ncbi:hypothetical protein F4819DRAFT_457557 [Hypoxylon fuscum]|nr:hypothetical protein F4819DRAFT_457557 [Hypoxylon fuscum]